METGLIVQKEKHWRGCEGKETGEINIFRRRERKTAREIYIERERGMGRRERERACERETGTRRREREKRDKERERVTE